MCIQHLIQYRRLTSAACALMQANLALITVQGVYVSECKHKSEQTAGSLSLAGQKPCHSTMKVSAYAQESEIFWSEIAMLGLSGSTCLYSVLPTSRVTREAAQASCMKQGPCSGFCVLAGVAACSPLALTLQRATLPPGRAGAGRLFRPGGTAVDENLGACTVGFTKL